MFYNTHRIIMQLAVIFLLYLLLVLSSLRLSMRCQSCIYSQNTVQYLALYRNVTYLLNECMNKMIMAFFSTCYSQLCALLTFYFLKGFYTALQKFKCNIFLKVVQHKLIHILSIIGTVCLGMKITSLRSVCIRMVDLLLLLTITSC